VLAISMNAPAAPMRPAARAIPAPSRTRRESVPLVGVVALYGLFLFMPPLYEHIDLKSTDIFIFLFNKTVDFKSTILDNSCILSNKI
jgi:hypothetical protein